MRLRIAVGIVLVSSILFSQTTERKKRAPHRAHRAVAADSLHWGPPPASAVQGTPPTDLPAMRSEIAVIDGDPSKPGVPFVLRIKAPDGEKVPPHWHPTDEHLTILQGTFVLSDGDKFQETGGTELNAGAYVTVPSRMWHYGRIKGDTILQIHGIGPFIINFGPLSGATPTKSGD